MASGTTLRRLHNRTPFASTMAIETTTSTPLPRLRTRLCYKTIRKQPRAILHLTEFCSPGDLQLLIQTYRDVNKHLDAKVEELTDQLATIKKEKEAWRRRSALLTETLQKCRREMTPFGTEVDTAELQRICQEITSNISEDDFQRDGVLISSLVERGLIASWFISSTEVTNRHTLFSSDHFDHR